MSGSPQPSVHRVTRAKNASQRPGLIVAPRKRRTKAEKQRDDELDRIAKEQEEAKKQDAIIRVAQLEDQMAVDDNNADSAHPRHSHGHKTQKAQLTVNESEAERPRKKRSTKDNFVRQDNKQGLPSEGAWGSRAQSKAETDMSRQAAAAIDISPEPEDGEDEPYLPCREERTLRAQPAGGSGDRMLVTESDIELTDTSEPTLMKSGKGLKRTYAMADIMPKKRARDVDLDVSDYEPLMDLEQGSETDDIAYEIELVSTDDEETPENRIIATEPAAKKANRGEPASNKVLGNDDYETSKKKATKLAVREAVHANRGEPASKKKEEVSNEVNLWNLRALTTWERSHRHHKFLTGTASHNKISGLIQSWATYVSEVASSDLSSKGPDSVRTATSSTLNSTARTTASSKAVVIPSKVNIKSKSISCVQGFVDEDEAEEPQAAVSRSIKGKERVNSSGIVKVDRTSESQAPISKSLGRADGRSDKYKLSDLPDGCMECNLWRGTVIPTFTQYMANEKTIWGAEDATAVAILQAVWDYVYGEKVPATVERTGPIFAIADQKLYEYRNSFGSAALMAINTFFDTNEGFQTDESRVKFSKEALDGYNFLFGDVVKGKNGKLRRKGIFRGPLVLQTFATHLTKIRGAITVPCLGDPARPKQALALATAAAERAFQLWVDGHITVVSWKGASKGGSGIIRVPNKETGSTSGKSTDFNHAGWAVTTAEYFASIETNFPDDKQLDEIIKVATTFLKNKRGDLKTTILDGDDNNDQFGERAHLVEDSESDSENTD